MPRLTLRRWAAIACFAAAAVCATQGLWIHAKAHLAQWLIAAAWQRGSAAADAPPPWPWADTHPIARLTIGQAPPLYVLENASGQSLAFGPAHDVASAPPGEPGNSVIEAHRDTHFAILETVGAGAVIGVETRSRRLVRYRVTAVSVVDSRRARIALGGSGRRLTLVTCYPFDTLTPGGPLRLVVSARAL